MEVRRSKLRYVDAEGLRREKVVFKLLLSANDKIVKGKCTLGTFL
jgi:hypothetical protein